MADRTSPDFTWIFNTYHERVLAYTKKLIGEEGAEDVAQEVFVKVNHSLPDLADPSRLGSWIYAITLNTVRDWARKRSAGIEPLPGREVSAGRGDEEDPMSGVPDTRSRDPEETAIWNEMVACYLDYVGALPSSLQEVFVLSEFDHLPGEEIARRLSISLPAVKIRLHRARARLHEELRRNCRCYHNERGELMGEPSDACERSQGTSPEALPGAPRRFGRG